MRSLLPCLAVTALLCPITAWSQQTYVGRYDVYTGFTYIDSPHVNLLERGFHTQAGLRMRTWYSLGFDYTRSTGHTSLGPALLTPNLQQELGGAIAQLGAAGLVPAGYSPTVPIASTSQTFAAGPQFAYRRWSAVTAFIRPSFGALHETATPHATNPIDALLSSNLVPAGQKQDWTPFYGFGGGAEVNVSRHFSLRFQVDFVHDHVFNDLLRDGRNTVRLSIGPGAQFGRNLVSR